MSLRVGVLGCADIALRRIGPALAALPETTVAAVAGRSPGRAAEFARAFDCAATDYSGLLARDDVDAVYLPLPPGLHFTWTRAALLAGKHVLVEKPLTPTSAEARELADLALARGLVLRENFMFLHHRQHHVVRQAVRDGVLGAVRSLSAEFSIPPRPDGDIRYDPALAGGALVDLGGYPIRLAQYLLGDGLTVLGAELTTDPDRGVDLRGVVTLAGDGVTADLRFHLGGAYTNEYTVAGDRRSVHVARAFTPPADFEPELRLSDGERLVAPAQDQVLAAVAAFASACAAPNARRERGRLARSVRTTELLDAVRGAGLTPAPR
ncbi:Gfo/Idh/MocA family protein [Actinophytocola oryzae]|uniref:Putative dehydrogenase n=1 Tax=Actinophytocola oryzae TaxID=502181 RepID=A0A4R7VFE1_9PSEU|nr:Gfo/Idh/MocA family oxidoreductase [Actinophytocola oryzae]TDV47960.1 putative dehydrogenase [Actinophytocola oryzae]